MSAASSQIKAGKKREIALRDQWRCWYCGRYLHLSIPARDGLTDREWYAHPDWETYGTIDHQIPQIQGGSHEMENLVFCCRTCNNQKKNRTVDGYRAYLVEQSPNARAHAHLLICLNLTETPYDATLVKALEWLDGHRGQVHFFGEENSG